MIVKWKLSRWSPSLIERVECERETSIYVWAITGNTFTNKKYVRRVKKHTEYEHLYDSWEEAKRALIDDLNEKMRINCGELKSLRGLIAQAESLQKPSTDGA